MTQLASLDPRGSAPAERPREQGLALLIVLWVIVAATLVVAAFNTTARSGVSFVSSEVEMTRTEAMADAGVEIAAARLIDDEKPRRWRADGKSHIVSFAGCDLIIAISDANGQIDLNKSDKELLSTFLLKMLGSEQKSLRLTDAIMKRRNKVKPKSAASRSIGFEEALRNDSSDLVFLDVSQLRTLDGMTPELFRRLAPLMTVYSRDGRISPASAPDEVLAGIPNITPSDIERLRHTSGSTAKEMEQAINEMSRHAAAFIADEPGPAYIVSVAVRRPNEKYSAGRVYVIATGLDQKSPYRLISKRPLGSATVGASTKSGSG
jgi:general secretion pathway protein K